MKINILVDISFSGKTYVAGSEVDDDNELIRQLLVNGLATPEDEAAEEFMQKTDQHERYFKQAFQDLAAELNG